MKLIADIRYYESMSVNLETPRFSGTGIECDTYHFDYKQIATHVLRFVLKLREAGYMMERDHLYIILTPVLIDGSVQIGRVSPYKEAAFYQPVFLGMEIARFHELPEQERVEMLIRYTSKIMMEHFSETVEERVLIETVAEQALLLGQDLEIKFKEKAGNGISAKIIVRVVSFDTLASVLRVEKAESAPVDFAIRSMRFDEFLNQIGTISITKSVVTIKPRTNIFTKNAGLTALSISV